MRKNVWLIGLLVIAGLLVIGGVALAQGGRNTPNVDRRGMMGGMWGNVDGTTERYGRGMMQWGNVDNGLCGGTCTGETGRGFGNNGSCDGTCEGNVDGVAVVTSVDQARGLVTEYLADLNNANLELKEVVEFENGYYAVVVEKDTGLGALELLVGKYSGIVRPEMGPAMMWNTKYGTMMGRGGRMGRGRYNGTPAEITVTADQARTEAQDWLKENLDGATLGTARQFYGYYSFQYSKDGKVQGVLSVNAYTGAVWEHAPLGGCLVD